MVVFNCNACGESLKKNQVEKHYQTRCRHCEVLSCVDCGKEFWGNDYQNHIKCISEEEKYSGKNYVPKVNKGEVKQDKWLEQVHAAIAKSKSNPRLQAVLQSLVDYPNIPRKRQKFENFLSNSLRIRDKRLTEQIWDILMSEKQTEEPQTSQNGQEPITDQSNQAVSGVQSTGVNGTVSIKSASQNSETTDKKLSKREKKDERKKKQHKKEKKDRTLTGCSEHANDGVVNGDNSVGRKAKKRKHQEAAADVEETEDTSSGQKSLCRKKKKKKHAEKEEEEEEAADRERRKQENRSESNHPQDAEAGEEDEDDAANWQSRPKIKLETLMVTLLQSKGELPLKKLKKKIIAEYSAQGALSKTKEKVWAKIEKKINKNPRFKVHKERVKLVA